MISWKDKRDFWITGAKIADPAGGKIKTGSVLVQKGIIAEVAAQKTPETDLPVLPEHLPGELGQRPFEVAESDPPVDQETF